MLLLSSATRIFGTTHPPAILHRASHSGCTAAKRVPCFHFIGASAGLRVNHPAVGLCRKSILSNCTLLYGLSPRKRQGVRFILRTPYPAKELLLATEGGYQGMIFFNPFFFLLLDSFLLSFLSVWLLSEDPLCDTGSGFVASPDWAAAAA